MNVREQFNKIRSNKFAVTVIVAVFLIVLIAVIHFVAFSAPQRQAGLGQFLVNTSHTDSGEVADN
ncbi:MAG: hypothetical protein V1916_00690, partial [Patescibacteria group bacterium]